MPQADDTVTTALTVLNGPDKGLERTFEGTATIGRGGGNTFKLTDGFVSNFHGEVFIKGGEVFYRDLRSRHGSLVCVDNVSFHLHDRNEASIIKLTEGSDIQIGTTLIRVHVLTGQRRSQRVGVTTDEEGFDDLKGMRETLITSSHRPISSLTQRISTQDERLAVIFKLASQLNGLTSLDAIMDLIIDAIFDAFPAANFFAMTMLDDNEEIEQSTTHITHHRPGSEGESEEPIISRSILKRVVETRESVLFVRDTMGEQLSQSIIDARITACLCAPLIGQNSLLGVIETDTRGQGSLFSKKDLDLFSVVASLAAFALERASLSDNIVEMFESFVYASVTAIEARDPTTAGHSERVTEYTLALAQAAHEAEQGVAASTSFSEDEFRELRYATLLHDFGKIAVSEFTIGKEARLPPMHMNLIAQRFETIKSLTWSQALERLTAEHASRGTPLTPELLQAARARHDAFSEELDAELTWLVASSRMGYLDDSSLERVRALGARTYAGPDGEAHAYLDRHEIENLTIRRGTLNDDEWAEMRSHSAYSRDYLERIPWSSELRNIPYIAGAHHEKLDGSGYPDGLTADQLPTQVRMMTIADIFDALTANDRPYRKAATVERAVSILREEASMGKLDHGLVELFVDVVIPRIKHHIPSLKRQLEDTNS